MQEGGKHSFRARTGSACKQVVEGVVVELNEGDAYFAARGELCEEVHR